MALDIATYDKLDRKEKAMTLRLSAEQDRKRNDLMILLNERTNAGAITKMIDKYPRLVCALHEFKKELNKTTQEMNMVTAFYSFKPPTYGITF
jgi:hypothetical protein